MDLGAESAAARRIEAIALKLQLDLRFARKGFG